MKQTSLSFLSGVILAASVAGNASGATLILSDAYDVAGTGSGFALDTGVNSGINPPVTRLSGSAAAGLRYVKTSGTKADSSHAITDNKFSIARVADSSTISLSAGVGAFDLAPYLNTLAATPANPAVYDITIKLSNAAGGNQRCSFAISSTVGTANAWDFAIQLNRVATTDAAYTLHKRISAGAAGGTGVNQPIGLVGTYPNEVSFLIRVTDAGAESATFSSRIQVSADGGASWLYDTQADPGSLPSGWRFPSASRFIFWDVAGNAGPVTYDDFSLTWLSGPTTATKTWTGAGADSNWSTSGNWSGGVPATGDAVVFTGTARQTSFNDLSGLVFPSLLLNNGGFNLQGNEILLANAITNAAGVNTLSANLGWNSSASKQWSIAAGSELVLNNTVTAEVPGDIFLTGGGTLRLSGTMNIGQATTANPAFVINEGSLIVSGGTFASRGGFRVGSLASATRASQVILNNNASFTLNVAAGSFRVGDSASGLTNKLVIDGSSLTMNGGVLGVPYAAGATGEVSQTGGTMSGAVLSFSETGAGQGTYIARNGTLAPYQIRENTSGGSSTLILDNVLLQSQSGASNAFFTGIDVADIQAGGLSIDATLADVTIGQALSGAGSLTNVGGNVTLTGANTYAGRTVVAAGKLVLRTQRSYDSVRVNDYAAMGVLLGSQNTTLTNNTLSFGAGTTLSFDLGSQANPTNALLQVNSLSASSAVSIELKAGLSLAVGTIPLIDYSGTIGGGPALFTSGTLSLPPGVSGTLIHNAAATRIDLQITAVPGYRWTGAQSTAWDFSTLNWLNLANNTPAVFTDGFPVEFLDGAATGTVDAQGYYPAPAAITVNNNTLPYVFNNGLITTPLLRKNGTNSLTRIGGESDSISSIELNAGSLIINNTYDSSGWALSDDGVGKGTLVKQGASTLTQPAGSSYDGNIIVQQGTLKLSANGSLGTTNGSTRIENGATLDINDVVPGHEPVFVSGKGMNDLGAIIDSTTATGVETPLRDVTLLGDTTFGSPNGGRWDIRIRSNTGPAPGLKGNGFNLTKVGSGHISIASQRNLDADSVYWDMNLGNVIINEGMLTFAEAVGLGNPSRTITVAGGASLGTYDLGATNPIVRNLTLGDAAGITAGGPGTSGSNIFTGLIQIAGTVTLRPNDAALILNGPISGPGLVTVSGTAAGRLFLNAVNTYTGDTIVTNSTVGGFGTIPGNLVMFGGALAPGMGVGTLTVNGNATLTGVTVMELDRSRAPNCDRLVVAGAISGSSVQVILGEGAPAPQSGDVYQLFNKGVSLPIASLPTLANGLSWDTSKLTVNGSIAVTGTAIPLTFGNVSVSNGNFVFSGTGGVEGQTYHVVTSPDVSAPAASWVPVATNVFAQGGSFTFTLPVDSEPAGFFRIKLP